MSFPITLDELKAIDKITRLYRSLAARRLDEGRQGATAFLDSCPPSPEREAAYKCVYGFYTAENERAEALHETVFSACFKLHSALIEAEKGA